MTPSKAHDSAWERSPEHDKMVVEVAEFLWQNKEKYPEEFEVYTEEREKEKYKHCIKFIECEAMHEGHTVFFSDILATFHSNVVEGRQKRQKWHYYSYEIKPIIYSCGALLRQVKVQKSLITQWVQQKHSQNSLDVKSDVFAIVCKDDPLLETLFKIGGEDFSYVWDKENKSLTPLTLLFF